MPAGTILVQAQEPGGLHMAVVHETSTHVPRAYASVHASRALQWLMCQYA